MAAKVTAELLDALLSTDTHRRQEAEAYFQAIPVNERVADLIYQVQQKNHLSAVLLRRDILRLSDARAVETLVDPLLSSFLAFNGSSTQRIACGHCLAEICGTVAALSPSPQEKEQAMTRILNAVSGAVSHHHCCSCDKYICKKIMPHTNNSAILGSPR